MATISTKYSVGDVVYKAGTISTQKRHPCPDCKGTRSWQAISPGGRGYTFSCPRCGGGYQQNNDLSLNYAAYVPHVDTLTIGSVRVDTHADCDEGPVSYMCVETGVGSGSVHREKTLFETREEAETAAAALAAGQNCTVEWIVKLYDKTLSLSDHQLHDAVKEGAERRDRERRYRLGYLIEDLRNAETIEAVKKRIEEWEGA